MGIDHNDKDIKLAAIECLGSYVESADTKDSKMYENLLINVLNSIWILLE